MTKNEEQLLEALREAYLLILQMPFDELRVTNQATFALVRDAIASVAGVDPEYIQNTFEEAVRK